MGHLLIWIGLTGIAIVACLVLFLVRVKRYQYGIRYTMEQAPERQEKFPKMQWDDASRSFIEVPGSISLEITTFRHLTPGWRYRIPILQRVETFEWLRATIPFSVDVTTRDAKKKKGAGLASGLTIRIKGSIQYEFDPALVGLRFGRIEEKTMSTNLVETLTGTIEALVGTIKDGEAVRGDREAFNRLLNSVVRLSTPLHVRDNIPPENWLKHYRTNAALADEVLRKESECKEDRSDTEITFAIDVINVALGSIDYTPEITTAMAEKKKAELEAAAATVRNAAVVKGTKELVAAGVTPDAAVTTAKVAAKLIKEEASTTRRVFEFGKSGEGLIAAILEKVLGGDGKGGK